MINDRIKQGAMMKCPNIDHTSVKLQNTSLNYNGFIAETQRINDDVELRYEAP